jgi:hypothetical protein
VFEHVVEGVRWIPGKDKFLPDSHMYVVGKPESDDFSLVDCGLMIGLTSLRDRVRNPLR